MLFFALKRNWIMWTHIFILSGFKLCAFVWTAVVWTSWHPLRNYWQVEVKKTSEKRDYLKTTNSCFWMSFDGIIEAVILNCKVFLHKWRITLNISLSTWLATAVWFTNWFHWLWSYDLGLLIWLVEVSLWQMDGLSNHQPSIFWKHLPFL